MHYASDGVLTCDYCTGYLGLHLQECRRPAELDRDASSSSSAVDVDEGAGPSSPGTIAKLLEPETHATRAAGE